MNKLTINNRGDTIVEVLIAITVLSLILGGAYTLTNRSLARIRDSQEHSEALKYAEAQIEQVKQLADNNGLDINNANIYTASDFCTAQVTSPTGLAIKPSTDADCTKTNGIPYRIAITRTPAGTNIHNFRVSVQWTRVGGANNNTVALNYHLEE